MSCPRLSFGGTVLQYPVKRHRLTASPGLRTRCVAEGVGGVETRPLARPPKETQKKSLDARLAIYGSTDCSTRARRPAPAARVPAAAPDGDLHPSAPRHATGLPTPIATTAVPAMSSAQPRDQ